MKILTEKPPNYADIIAVFPEVADFPNAVFTYGDTIYSPGNQFLPEYLVAHEEVHIEQQGAYPGGAVGWWQRYLVDPEFRLSQEAPAYRREFQVFCTIYTNRNKQFDFLNYQSTMLSSVLYGNLVTRSEAMRLINGMQ